jgi:hypothetical protein
MLTSRLLGKACSLQINTRTDFNVFNDLLRRGRRPENPTTDDGPGIQVCKLSLGDGGRRTTVIEGIGNVMIETRKAGAPSSQLRPQMTSGMFSSAHQARPVKPKGSAEV